jgi:hypothetical protein
MEYIDSQVDIHDEELPDQQLDVSLSIAIDTLFPSVTRPQKRESLPRRMSDISLHRLFNDSTKSSTELKGREHVLRVMKTNVNKPMTVALKGPRLVQEMIARRQETTRSLSEFAVKYGLMDHQGKSVKSRETSNQMCVNHC